MGDSCGDKVTIKFIIGDLPENHPADVDNPMMAETIITMHHKLRAMIDQAIQRFISSPRNVPRNSNGFTISLDEDVTTFTARLTVRIEQHDDSCLESC